MTDYLVRFVDMDNGDAVLHRMRLSLEEIQRLVSLLKDIQYLELCRRTYRVDTFGMVIEDSELVVEVYVHGY